MIDDRVIEDVNSALEELYLYHVACLNLVFSLEKTTKIVRFSYVKIRFNKVLEK